MTMMMMFTRTDGKHPDGTTLIPWHAERYTVMWSQFSFTHSAVETQCPLKESAKRCWQT